MAFEENTKPLTTAAGGTAAASGCRPLAGSPSALETARFFGKYDAVRQLKQHAERRWSRSYWLRSWSFLSARTNAASINLSLPSEMKSCTRFSNRARINGLKTS
jgi:hypothetical protein